MDSKSGIARLAVGARNGRRALAAGCVLAIVVGALGVAAPLVAGQGTPSRMTILNPDPAGAGLFGDGGEQDSFGNSMYTALAIAGSPDPCTRVGYGTNGYTEAYYDGKAASGRCGDTVSGWYTPRTYVLQFVDNDACRLLTGSAAPCTVANDVTGFRVVLGSLFMRNAKSTGVQISVKVNGVDYTLSPVSNALVTIVDAKRNVRQASSNAKATLSLNGAQVAGPFDFPFTIRVQGCTLNGCL